MTTASGGKPRLYHAPSSYYSTIARLALAEGGVAYQPVYVDIHYSLGQQLPNYVRLNPNMTVPTLVLPDRILVESRDIADYALGGADATGGAETRAWLDLQYGLKIDELTFGTLLARYPVARIMVPKALARSRRHLLALAEANPDLAALYRARAEIFAERLRVLDPAKAAQLAGERRAQAIDIMDRLERALGDRRAFLVPAAYGAADVVMTVFLSRMGFLGLGAEILSRPALARYWNEMRARPSFAAADVWTKLHVLRLIGAIVGFGRG